MPAPEVSVERRVIDYEQRSRGSIQHITAERLVVDAPYHPDFVAAIKGIGGKWHPSLKRWHCALAAEDALRELLTETYGTDGSVTPPLVALVAEWTLGGTPEGDDLYLAGKQVIARGRVQRGVTRGDPNGSYSLTIADVPAALAIRAVNDPPMGWRVRLDTAQAQPGNVTSWTAEWDAQVELARRTLDWLEAHRDEFCPSRDGSMDGLLAELEARLMEVTR